MPRPSTGKRLRFEVFKRDYFTCQYCGAQPPAVVLVVDHIEAVAAGGASSIDNVITACEACNQGKAHKPLGDRAVRPDADLLYLQTQQEIAELERYRAALADWESELMRTVLVLQELWCKTGGLDWHPADHILRQMLCRYAPEVVGEAVVDVAPTVATGDVRQAGWLPYLWRVAKSRAEEVGDAGCEEEDDA